MRSRRRFETRDPYYRDQYPEQYEDRFGSRSYRSSADYGEGPFGSEYQADDEYADAPYYFRRGERYYSDAWLNDGEPFDERLRDEYDRYGVGLSRGRYHGEPYGSMRPKYRDGGGFVRRIGRRVRGAWERWRD